MRSPKHVGYAYLNFVVLLVSTLLVWLAVGLHYVYRGVLFIAYISDDLHFWLEEKRNNLNGAAK